MKKFFLCLLLVSLSGCGNGSMQTITSRAEKAKTKQQLEAALGKADKFEKVNLLGLSAESWTYKASDGEVNFTILNDKVQTVATLPKDDKKSDGFGIELKKR